MVSCGRTDWRPSASPTGRYLATLRDQAIAIGGESQSESSALSAALRDALSGLIQGETGPHAKAQKPQKSVRLENEPITAPV